MTVSGTIRQAQPLCAANGGGSGTTGSPWQAACIQAAINAASNGDTVYLAAGNWQLNSTLSPVTTAKQINLVGAGSGNTFDAYGHPNNGGGNAVGTNTRVFTSGSSGTGGWIKFLNCTTNPGPSISHIFVDGSVGYAGGDGNGTVNFDTCPNGKADDIRAWSSSISGNTESQFYVFGSNNFTTQNSVIAESPGSISGGLYGSNQSYQSQFFDTQLLKNNVFYMFTANPFYMDNITFTMNNTVMGCDATACSSGVQIFGPAGCSVNGCFNSSTTGNYHLYAINNLFNALGTGSGTSFGTGGGVNDPSGAGIINDLQWTGNWVIGTDVNIAGCDYHIAGGCPSGVTTGGLDGMQVNGLTVTNNSLVGSSSALLDATGTGITGSVGSPTSCTSPPCNQTTVNYNAQKNYLSSPSNQYLHDAQTVTPTVTGNFCAGTGTFTGCTTTGFTTPPTCSFTIGKLSGSTVPITSTSFTAQYGSVQYLTSTSSTTPTSGDARWNVKGLAGANNSYIPPLSLASVSAGQTVYMWVMDNAPTPHIASCGSAAVSP